MGITVVAPNGGTAATCDGSSCECAGGFEENADGDCVPIDFESGTIDKRVNTMKTTFDSLVDEVFDDDKQKAKAGDLKDKFMAAANKMKSNYERDESKNCDFVNSDRAPEPARMGEACNAIAAVANKLANLAFMNLNCKNGRTSKPVARKMKTINKKLEKWCP